MCANSSAAAPKLHENTPADKCFNRTNTQAEVVRPSESVTLQRCHPLKIKWTLSSYLRLSGPRGAEESELTALAVLCLHLKTCFFQLSMQKHDLVLAGDAFYSDQVVMNDPRKGCQIMSVYHDDGRRLVLL